MKTSHAIGRREFVHRLTAAAAVWPLVKTPARAAGGGAPIDIGSRRELFVDDFLIATAAGVGLRLHKPVAREVSLVCDRPWEGNTSAYYAIFQDGGRFRAYYRGSHVDETTKKRSHPEFTCYAESEDGIKWVKPDLGLIEFNGSKNNNIVWAGAGTHNFTVFKDDSPGCDSAARYKALAGGTIAANGKKKGCLNAFKSADGIRWTPMAEAVITEGAFDSQNLAFWDALRGEYVEYHRGFKDGVRGIMTSAAKTLTAPFPAPQWLEYPGVTPEHLYTNQIQPYFRAPHIFLGFPMRYTDRGWSEPVVNLPGLAERIVRAGSGSPRYGTAVTDAVFMSSRDGLTFRRWPEAFIRPGPRRSGSWVYGDNFVFWGMLQTPSTLGDAPDELSLFATEGYWEGVATSARRYTIRMDGFVSATAPMAGGEVVTKPLRFEGGNLALNLETSGAGSVQVEVQDEAGTPVPGYALADCPPIYGDHLQHIVRWAEAGGDLRPFSGKPVRLRFVLKDADLYALQFVPYAPDPPLPKAVGLIPRKDTSRQPFVALDETFAGVPAGVSPTTDDLDPTPKPEGTGWKIVEGSPDRVQVLCDDPPGSGQRGTTPYLSVVRRDEKRGEGGCAWLVLSPQDAADSTNGVAVLTARIRVPSTNAYLADIDAFDDQPEGFHKRAFHVRFSPKGVVSYYDSEKEQPIAGVTIKPDTWQQVVIRADLRTATFDLTIEGQKATGLPFTHPDVHRLQSISFGPNTSKCALFVSSVKLEITP